MPGNVIVLAIEDNLPVFGVIVLIVYAHKSITFVVQKQVILDYVTNLHAYEVSNSEDIVAVKYSDLCDWHPLSISAGFGKHKQGHYVVPRYEILPH